LIALLRASRPELLEAVEFDTEAGAVWMTADRRETLEAVSAVIDRA
jgi:hypothetical protein